MLFSLLLSILIIALIVMIVLLTIRQEPYDPSHERRIAFSNIFKYHFWGKQHPNGIGSLDQNTGNDVSALHFVIKKYNIQSIMDCGCGLFTWMRHVMDLHPNVQYTGIDIVHDQIEENKKRFPQYTFLEMDICSDDIPHVSDLIFSKEMTQHLKKHSTIDFLKKCPSKGKYLLITSFDLPRNSEHVVFSNNDIPSLDKGAYREQDFRLSPYNDYLLKPLDRFFIRVSLHGSPQFLQLFQLYD